MYRIIREMRRRHIFRGAGFYLVGAWVVLQVGDVIVEPAGLPGWTMTALLYLALMGFPLAMYLGWRYDFTEQGIVRTRAASGSELEQADLSLRPSDYLILLALVTVTCLAGWQLLSDIRNEANIDQQPAISEQDAPPHSIAVLPFTDISEEQDQGYLGDGISDKVLLLLSRVGGLSVTARTSSFSFKGKDLDIRQIANSLGVANVLEGSVQSDGDQVRIIARLIEAKSGTELWSSHFDRKLEAIFEIQDEIAQEVVTALKVAVLEEDQVRLEARYQPKLESYEQLIRGRTELDKGTVAGLKAAKAHFEKAIELDPRFSDPYVDLASTYGNSALNPGISVAEAAALRRPLIDKALDLDPRSAAAHTALAYLLWSEGKAPESIQSFQRAVELNPNYAAAYAGLGRNASLIGDLEQGLDYIQTAVKLDPEESRYQLSLANAYWNLAQSEKAMAIVREVIRREPDKPGNYDMMSRWLMQLGRAGEAMKYTQARFSMDPDNAVARKAVCEMYVQLWDNEAALVCMNEYIDAYPEDIDMQQKRAGMSGDYETAINLGRRMMEESPNFKYRAMQLAFWLSYAHRWEEVINTIQMTNPELFQPDPEISPWSIWPATHLAQALMETGQTEQGAAVAHAGIAFIQSQRKLQGGAWIMGIEDAQLYAVLGEREKMLQTLDHAIDRDWMFYSSSVADHPTFKNYRDDPEFQDLVERQATKMAEQRAWYKAHKNDPL